MTVNANTQNTTLGKATSRSSSRRDKPWRSGARDRHVQHERPGASRRGRVYVRRHGDCSTGCTHGARRWLCAPSRPRIQVALSSEWWAKRWLKTREFQQCWLQSNI